MRSLLRSPLFLCVCSIAFLASHAQTPDPALLAGCKANVAQQLYNIPKIDLSNMGRNASVEISGLIGFMTLRELVMTIGYRDSLVHVVYDPQHGFHSH